MQDQAYFVSPPAGPGPGVLLLPSWWGLTRSVKARADQLADSGFTVLVPDLSFGQRPETEQEAETALGRADPNRLASLVKSSAALVAGKSTRPAIGAVGFGMGGSLALWLAVRRPQTVSAAVSFYGSQTIDFAGAAAAFLVHLAEEDRFISEDDAAFMEATMGLEGLDVTVHRHAGTRHGFADEESADFDPIASEQGWAETVAFLAERLADQ